MKKQIAAAVAAVALTIGGLALAAPASADDTTQTQEVASSPESTPSTQPSLTPPTTDPEPSPTTESPAPTPADETATPGPESSGETSQPTASPESGPSTSPSTEAPSLSSGTPTTPETKPAPEAAGDEWFTWLLPVTSLPADQQGHVGALAEWFPQQPVGLGQIAPQPGTCVQQDHYTGPRHKLDALYAAPLTWNAEAGHASDNDIPGVKVVDWNITCTPQTPPTVQQCETFTDGGTATGYGEAQNGDVIDANGWSWSETRATGHNVFVDGGLHVYTEGSTSTDKAAGYHALGVPLAQIGTPSLSLSDASGVVPGIQLVLDSGRILVGEPSYYGDRYWSKTAQAGVPANDGYPASADLNTWLAALPDATVAYVGYSLGSGVQGDVVLTQVTAGCRTFEFDYQALPPVVVNDASGAVAVTAATCDKQGVASPAGVEHATLQGELDQTPGAHTAVLVADEGHAFADGSTTLELPYTVPAATGNCPVTTPTPTPSQSVTPTSSETPAPIVATSDDSLAQTGSTVNAGGPVMLAGLFLALGVLALAGGAEARRRRTAKN